MSRKRNFLQENWLLIVVILYIILPIDLIPDRVPLFGTLDDAGLLLVHILTEYAKWKKNNEGGFGEGGVSSTNESNVKEGEIVQ